jgi:predicted Zn finger-like uncharacterized protein
VLIASDLSDHTPIADGFLTTILPSENTLTDHEIPIEGIPNEEKPMDANDEMPEQEQPTDAISAVSPETSIISENTIIEETNFEPIGTAYCTCGVCKTAYVVTEEFIGKGKRVKCGVCNKEWFQTADKLDRTDDTSFLTNLSENKIQEVRKILSQSNIPKLSRFDKYELFVGNIPYQYIDDDLIQLFADYGVTVGTVAKGENSENKGFGFIQVNNNNIIIIIIIIVVIIIILFLSYPLFR